MAIRAFFCQNVASGCAFGGFGVTVIPLQEQFGASRGMATLGLALAVLVIGLTSPFIATLFGRFGLRWTMSTGVLLSGLGYALLSVAPSMEAVLLIYALPIGIGFTMFGPLAASVLTGNWFSKNAGTALGFVNMPLFLALLPIIGQIVIRDHGLAPFYLILAALHLLLLPLTLSIVDAPAGVAEEAPDPQSAPSQAPWTMAAVMRQPIFWASVAGGGILSAVGIIGVTHLFALGLEQGVAPEQAAMLASLLGAASVIGSLLVGFLCGRIGPSQTLTLIGAGFGLSWLILLLTPDIRFMVAGAIVMGTCTAGIFPAVTMVSARAFGQASVARVVGVYSLLATPPSFLLPPLAGVLHDAVGGYQPVSASIIGGCVAVTLIFWFAARLAAPRASVVATA
jgi:MFS family permease